MDKDKKLLARLKSGDRRAFEELLDLYGPRVQNLARRYALSPSDAEDLTQEIFLSIFQSVGSFRGESELTTWITRVAFNHGLRWKEKHQREAVNRDSQAPSEELELPCPDPNNDPAKRQGRTELSGQVHAAIGELSEPHREIITLHELHGLTYSQCAQVLQIPVGTVKSRLSNAFSQLRSTLRPYVLNEEQNASTLPLKTEGAGGTP
jgi:RNA polymerase sigma-70 factor (ECF subfamily)